MATKKKRDFMKVPLHMQPDRVLDELFNDSMESEVEEKLNNLAPVAFSGSYKDLKDAPTSIDGSYNDQPIKDRLDALEVADQNFITKDQIATSDEVLAMYK